MAQLKPPLLSQDAWRKALYAQGKIDQEAAIRWLSVHWPIPRRQCPICAQSDQWGVGDEVIRFRDPALVAKYPCVAVVCQSCGHTIFFNLLVMGIMPEGQR